METAATPAEQQTPATPAEAQAATPAENSADTVQVSKEELDQLRRDAARAATAQREAEAMKRKATLYDKLSGKSQQSPFSRQAAPKSEPTEEEAAEQARREDAKAERLIVRLAAEPKYRAVLDADPTLREMMVNNPLAVLPVLAPDAIDAEDALSLITEKLETKLNSIQAQKPAASAPAAPTEEPEKKPQAKSVEERVKEASEKKDLHAAISGMIGAKLTK